MLRSSPANYVGPAYSGIAMPMRRFFCLVLILGTLVLSGCAKPVELLSGLSESEANEVLGALLKASISAQKNHRKDGYYLELDSALVAAAIETLRNQGLPRQRYSKMGEVFKKENLISSPLEERARYIFALSQELEQTISQIDGVIAARVHVALAERAAPGEPNTPSSASVFIKHLTTSEVTTVVAQIKDLVSNSIPGLTISRVSVVLVPAKTPPTSATAPIVEDVLFFQLDHRSAVALRVLLVAVCLLGLLFVLFTFADWRRIVVRVRHAFAAIFGRSASSSSSDRSTS